MNTFPIVARALLPLVVGWALACPPAVSLAAEGPPTPQPADALVATAIRHEHGEGVKKNVVLAAELYCIAARQGNADAAYRLGWMYANGRGLQRDDGHAAALFQRAAGQGHEHARRITTLVRSDDARLPECITSAVPLLTEHTRATQLADAAAASPPPPPPAPANPAATDRALIEQALSRWAAAWSKQDLAAYFAAYAGDFIPANGRSHAQWQRDRRTHIAGKAWISVSLGDLDVAFDAPEQARVYLVQDYRSDRFRQGSRKTLLLAKAGPTWLIRQEHDDGPARRTRP